MIRFNFTLFMNKFNNFTDNLYSDANLLLLFEILCLVRNIVFNSSSQDFKSFDIINKILEKSEDVY